MLAVTGKPHPLPRSLAEWAERGGVTSTWAQAVHGELQEGGAVGKGGLPGELCRSHLLVFPAGDGKVLAGRHSGWEVPRQGQWISKGESRGRVPQAQLRGCSPHSCSSPRLQSVFQGVRADYIHLHTDLLPEQFQTTRVSIPRVPNTLGPLGAG